MQVTIRRMGTQVALLEAAIEAVGAGGSGRDDGRGRRAGSASGEASGAQRMGREASRTIAAAGEDALALPDFSNEEDKNWTW